MTMDGQAKGPRAPHWRALALVLPIALVLCFRTPYQASDLAIVPDSVEYAVGAQRLVTLGSYDIEVDGQALPPRYPPWFSAVVLAPAYWLGGPSLGNGIVPVLLFSLVGVAAAYGIGVRIGGWRGGAAAAVALLAVPDYRYFSQRIMTEAPTVALTLLAALAFLVPAVAVRSPVLGWRWLALGGLLAAAAAALRPVAGAVALPFVLAAATMRLDLRRRATALLLVALPALALLAATLAYNRTTFGDPWRSGYGFWCPVPYDYPRLTFASAYVAENLRTILGPGKLAAAVGLFALSALLVAQRPAARARVAAPTGRLLLFAALATGPAIALHSLYFFTEPRFTLSAVALLVVASGALLGAALGRLPDRAALAALVLVLATAGAWRALRAEPTPERRRAADRIAQRTPGNAVIVTAIDPVYLEPSVLRDSERRIIPISRDVEYASKIVAWKRIPRPTPAPTAVSDHRCPGLIAGGAREAVAEVAVAASDPAGRALDAGLPVYLDTGGIGPAHARWCVKTMSARFALERLGDSLYKLTRPPS